MGFEHATMILMLVLDGRSAGDGGLGIGSTRIGLQGSDGWRAYHVGMGWQDKSSSFTQVRCLGKVIGFANTHRLMEGLHTHPNRVIHTSSAPSARCSEIATRTHL